MFVPILLGTGRDSNSSKNVANYVFDRAKDYEGFETELIDVRDFHSEVTIPAWVDDEKKKSWKETMIKADGLIIVCPEYNHSFPGELKILLDTVYDEYKRKPMGICTVSSGGIGGTRVAEQLHLLALGLKMVPTPNPVYFTSVKDLFDDDGKMTNERFDEKMDKFFEDFTWYVKSLKEGRDQ